MSRFGQRSFWMGRLCCSPVLSHLLDFAFPLTKSHNFVCVCALWENWWFSGAEIEMKASY